MAELNPDADPVFASPAARYLTGSLAGTYLAGSSEPEEAGLESKSPADDFTTGSSPLCPVKDTSQGPGTCLEDIEEKPELKP